MDPSEVNLPPLKDLTIDNITENVNLVNSTNPSPRFKFLLERLVVHLHDYARETRLSHNEWLQAIQFLTSTGQICSDVRQEFILLSDILGLSLLVDSVDHPKPPGSTEGTVLGPFHTHDAEHLENGCIMSYDHNGEPLLVTCTVKDIRGNPIPDVKIDIWETDSSGMYDVQHAGRDKPDGRCILTSDKEGKFWFKGIVPVPYPIPHDGPVGKLLLKLSRHPMRPSHMHFMFEKEGWDKLVTALYLRGDPYETSDAVFGVKESLIVELGQVDKETAGKYPGTHEGMRLLTYDFVLVTEKETAELRDRNSIEALKKLNMTVRIVDGLPVPDVNWRDTQTVSRQG
ncbi:catechol dioxygenase [Bimuria novae-zelandiae CBS 107.79]|uniref:Catechol dioxygenase n=1 Tax=Bimuria novae-zelandiae CBS 107.79 TaxID=1447943 RepID=A0A6A5VSS8_9PLEO|nr:catechol dioxygenase [Bimuria novae-zelandiae CBS 107.79]